MILYPDVLSTLIFRTRNMSKNWYGKATGCENLDRTLTIPVLRLQIIFNRQTQRLVVYASDVRKE